MPTANRKGITLHYEVSGSGPALVLTHCFFFDSSFFKHQVPALERTHRVINIDIRGHGRSGPSESPFTLYDLADDAMAVLDAEGVKSAIWMGHSIGGYLSYRAALTRPERVSALIILDADAGADSPWNKVKYTTLKWGLQAFGPQFVVPIILQIMLGKTTLQSRPELRAECYRKLMEMRVKSVYPGVDAIIGRDDLMDRLKEIRVPTLMVVGEEEKPFPVRKAKRIAGGIPGAALALIPQAGHLSPIENPGPVTDAVTRFLTALQ